MVFRIKTQPYQYRGMDHNFLILMKTSHLIIYKSSDLIESLFEPELNKFFKHFYDS